MIDVTSLTDVGGTEPDTSAIYTSDIIGYLSGIDATLMTKNDPRWGEFVEFCNSIDSDVMYKIDMENISNGKYDGLDLSGDKDNDYSPKYHEYESSDYLFDEATISIMMMNEMKARVFGQLKTIKDGDVRYCINPNGYVPFLVK